MRKWLAAVGCTAALGVAFSAGIGQAAPAKFTGWLEWRGPAQDGVAPDKGLTANVAAPPLWHAPIQSGGSPVLANGKGFVLAYDGQGPDLQEALVCFDPQTGKKLWERRFNDFLSDIIYDRYAIGSPAIDPETGNVFVTTSAGLFLSYTPDGKLNWRKSLMEEIGRLTFPNGRTGGPIVDGDLVIIRFITSNWGADGPASDRFYAYDKASGDLVWSSTPGVGPKDNSFARPVLAWRNGKRVLYTGEGSGHLVCLNARTGQPIWRFALSAGGVNSSVILYKNLCVGIHADENIDNSEVGRMTAIRVDQEGKPAEGGAPLLDPSVEAWRNVDHGVSSSPVLVGNKIYFVNKVGEVLSINADTGKEIWKVKLGPDQLHASPTYADGKLYVPLQNGMLFVVKPLEQTGQILSKVQLKGRCLGAPAVYDGKVYVTTTEALYCFGAKGNGSKVVAWPTPAAWPKPGPAVALQVIPSEVRLRPGQKIAFKVRGIDANGFPTGPMDPAKGTWAKFIPPTARVRAEMKASVNSLGELVADADPVSSAGAWECTLNGLKGYTRGRVMPDLPIKEDFEGAKLDQVHATEAGVNFAYPPLTWIGARFKWEIRDVDGNKAFAKTLDNVFFQRATVFVGHPETKNYTLEADVRADGNRRTISTVGLINQHYVIALSGNQGELEVSSNHERIKVAVPFKIVPKEWYRLKTRVDVAADGSGVVRAKAWKRGESEPAAWTIEVPHKHAHTEGAPGLFGFSPQSLFRCYIDNISITPNN